MGPNGEGSEARTEPWLGVASCACCNGRSQGACWVSTSTCAWVGWGGNVGTLMMLIQFLKPWKKTKKEGMNGFKGKEGMNGVVIIGKVIYGLLFGWRFFICFPYFIGHPISFTSYSPISQKNSLCKEYSVFL